MASNERFTAGDLVQWEEADRTRTREGRVVCTLWSGRVVVELARSGRSQQATRLALDPDRLLVIESAVDRPPWE